jgi:hypothetical protein
MRRVVLLLAAAGCRQFFDLDTPIARDASIAAKDGTPDASSCEPVTEMPPDGHHNPGMGCMTSAGCHDETLGLGVGATAYSYAGTLYKDSFGGAAFPGGTIVVLRGTAERKLVTAVNGNFWIASGMAGLDPPTNTNPATARASACPSYEQAMPGMLLEGDGNCNMCHRNGGGVASPMHLP